MEPFLWGSLTAGSCRAGRATQAAEVRSGKATPDFQPYWPIIQHSSLPLQARGPGSPSTSCPSVVAEIWTY